MPRCLRADEEELEIASRYCPCGGPRQITFQIPGPQTTSRPSTRSRVLPVAQQRRCRRHCWRAAADWRYLSEPTRAETACGSYRCILDALEGAAGSAVIVRIRGIDLRMALRTRQRQIRSPPNGTPRPRSSLYCRHEARPGTPSGVQVAMTKATSCASFGAPTHGNRPAPRLEPACFSEDAAHYRSAVVSTYFVLPVVSQRAADERVGEGIDAGADTVLSSPLTFMARGVRDYS